MTTPPPFVFVNQHYHPDVAATGQVLADLAEYLVERGHAVEVLCAQGRYQAGHLDAPVREIRRGVAVRRYWTPGIGRRRHLGRIGDYLAFTVQVASRLLLGPKPSAIIALTTPPLLPALMALIKRVRGVPYAVWSMDLHPEAEVAAGMLRDGGGIGRVLFELAGDGYRNADLIVALGDCMRRLIENKGVAAESISVVPIWAPNEYAEPTLREQNRLAEKLGMAPSEFLVMYSGNAGLAHLFDPLLEAARRLEGDGRTRFLFVGDGPRRPEIERFVRSTSLSCLTYLDYFPRDQLPDLLCLGDVHLVSLRPEFEGIAVPAKLYGIMAASRPVLFVGPETSETGRTIQEVGCGEVVDPRAVTNPADRVFEILRLWRDVPELRTELGARGRSAYLERFLSSRGCESFERALRAKWQSLHPDWPQG